jgi:hypothetical protein
MDERDHKAMNEGWKSKDRKLYELNIDNIKTLDDVKFILKSFHVLFNDKHEDFEELKSKGLIKEL